MKIVSKSIYVNSKKVFLYPSLGGSFSMNRYLKGLKEGFNANSISYEIVKPLGQGFKAKYLDYPRLAWSKRNQPGKHLLISERYAYLLTFMCKDSIVVCHDLHTLYSESNTRLLHRLIYKFFLLRMLKASKVLCVSQHTKSDLLQFSPKFKLHPRVDVVHNGIEFFWLDSGKVKIKNTRWSGIFEQKIILLSVGTDSWYKNNQWSLRFLAKLDARYHLLRIGALSAANEQLIEELGLNNRLTKLQFINDEELKFCYQNAKALLFPSLSEGYGWPALEAALCNCVIISEGEGATKEIFRDSNDLIPLDDAVQYLNSKSTLQSKPNYSLWKDQVIKLIE